MGMHSILLVSFIAGVIATTGMSLFVMTFRQIGALHVNPVQAIGSVAGGSLRGSIPVGWFIHGVMGLIFATLYTLVLARTGVLDLGVFPLIIACAVMGFCHGLVVSFLLVISVGEHHPLRQFRVDGMELAGIYFAAHVVYGLLIGTTLLAVRPFLL